MKINIFNSVLKTLTFVAERITLSINNNNTATSLRLKHLCLKVLQAGVI